MEHVFGSSHGGRTTGTRGGRRTAGMVMAVAMTSVVVPLAHASPAAATPGGCTPVAFTNCARLTYTGSTQDFVVPAGVTDVYASLWGAGGASATVEGFGGGGGWTVGAIPVTPGQVLKVTVGERGHQNSTVGTYGGGGPGGDANAPTLENGLGDGGSGGGMSAIWLTSYGVGPLLIAGGGGAASIEVARNGGGGGGNVGNKQADAAAGAGGTQIAGGARGNNGCQDSTAGSAYLGGAGGDGYEPGGGGGGGYYGGGGGDCRISFISALFAGAGGGGSGYINTAGVSGATTYATNTPVSAGTGDPMYQAGIGAAQANGQVVIQWNVLPTATPKTSSGPAGAVQTTTVTIPDAGGITLLDADDVEQETVTVPGQGTYTVNTATGVITFTPIGGFSGTATPVKYRVSISELHADSTYTPTVVPDAPAVPTPSPLTSTGVGTAVQTVTAVVPAGHTVTLVGAAGQATTTVTVATQGTYTLNPSTGVITFTPVPDFQGTATPAGYRLTNAAGRSGDSTYTPTVTKPAGPNPTAKTSSGLGTAIQTTAVDLPAGGTVELLSGGTPGPTRTVSGQGTYSWNATDRLLTFTPAAGYVGVVTTATYRVTDAYGQYGESTYTATVTIPPPPDAPDRTTSGVGVTPQTATLPVPAKGTIALIDANGNPTTSLFIPDKGTYTLQLTAASGAAAGASIAGVTAAAGGTVPNPSPQPGTATVIFTPVLGFSGQLPPVDYQITDSYGQTATATYTPLVTIPAPPAPPSETTAGPPDKTQTATLTVPSGGSITLLDPRGRPAILVRVAGQGTYVLQPANGHISFVAVTGFAGQAKAVRYRVTDAYGQVAESTYSAFVFGTALAVTGLGLLDLILVGATMIPTGATLVVLGRPRLRFRRRLLPA